MEKNIWISSKIFVSSVVDTYTFEDLSLGPKEETKNYSKQMLV